MTTRLLILTIILSSLAAAQGIPAVQRFREAHVETIYWKGTNGIDTAKAEISNGNLRFYYRYPTSVDSVIFIDSATAASIYRIKCYETGDPVPQYNSTLVVPADTTAAWGARIFLNGIIIIHRQFTYVDGYIIAALDMKIHDHYYDSTMWVRVGYYSYYNTSYDTDSVLAGNIDLNMNYQTWDHYEHATGPGYTLSAYTMDLHAGQTVEYKISVYYVNAGPAVPPNGGCSNDYDPNAFPPTYGGGYGKPTIIWTKNSTYPVAAGWALSGYWETKNLHIVDYLYASRGRFYGGLQAFNALFDYSVVVGSSVWPGSLALYNFGGNVSNLTAYDSTDAPYILNSEGGHLATKEHLPVVVGTGLLSASTVGDTTTMSWTGADSGSVRSYITQPADKVPGSASGFNDEFNATSFDTLTKWTPFNWASTATITALNSVAVLRDTSAAASNKWRILEQTITDTAFTIVAKITAPIYSANYTTAGILVRNSSTGRFIAYGPAVAAATYANNVTKWTDATTYSSTPLIGNAPYGTASWFKLVKTPAKAIEAWYSTDGINFNRFWTEATSTFVENSGTIDRIGFGICVNNASLVSSITVWYFRVNWTADFHPTLDN